MIHLLEQTPDNIAAFLATGEITKNDFETVIVPTVERLVQQQGNINFLLLLDTSLRNFTMGAWLQDAVLGLKNLMKWHRAAIVSDSDAITAFTNAFSVVISGEFKGFARERLPEAIAWTASNALDTGDLI